MFLLVFFVAYYVMDVYCVLGDSMLPLLHDQEYVLSIQASEYKRGDIVICFEPDDPTLLVKEIVGEPGDTIDSWRLYYYVNNEETDIIASEGDSYPEADLGPDEYYVVGRNFEVSHDSRAFGPLPKENIIGKVRFVVYPYLRSMNEIKEAIDEE